MSGFLYYIPRRTGDGFGEQAVTPEMLRALGLHHLSGEDFDDGPVSVKSVKVTGGGPAPKDGGEGLLFCLGGANAPRLKFDPANQTWERMPGVEGAGGGGGAGGAGGAGGGGGGGVWIGYETAAPPTPQDLARPERLSGYAVRMADNREWVVPTALALTGGQTIPQVMVLGHDGKVVRQPHPRYVSIASDAERIYEQVMIDAARQATPEGEAPEPEPEGFERLQDDELFAICVRALATNYRVGPAEVSMLRVIDTRCAMLVAYALIDRDAVIDTIAAMLAAQKKSSDAPTPDGSATSPGDAA